MSDETENRLRVVQQQRARILTAGQESLRGVILLLDAGRGRPESAELTLAKRKLQEALFWIDAHLGQMWGLEETAPGAPLREETKE